MRDRSLGRWLCAVAVAMFAMAGLRDEADRRIHAWVAGTELPSLTPELGVEVLARDGSLLRAFQVGDGRWRLDPGAVDPLYLRMLLGWEDQRFPLHHGVDGKAVLRSVGRAVRHGRIVSGGSTLTMQVARLLEGGPTGQWTGKLRQIRVAWALEARLSKDEILDLYLRLAPYGANIEGVRAASLSWFGKAPARLTPAQAALLIALPQSPQARRPDLHPQASRAARDRVLARTAELGVISQGAAEAAMTEPMPTARRPFPVLAPLLTARLKLTNPGVRRIPTTIDPQLQRRAQTLATQATRGRNRRLSAGVMLANHQNGEILAQVGTAGWTDTPRAGWVDMTQALRSPGSTLKPFVYALAFEDGLAHPETLIEDRPAMFGRWQPSNFDNQFRGTVSVRQALTASLNLPVVRVAEAIGPSRIVQALHRAGADIVVPGGQPGLAVVLGGAGVSLEGLLQAYATLARGGRGISLSPLPGEARRAPMAAFGAVSAWQVGHILAEIPAPPGGRNERIAYKTGTSYGHRDALALGFDGKHVGAVWLGRADGTPVPGAFGGDVAAPVLFEMFGALDPVPLPPPPPATLLGSRDTLPLPLRQFAAAGEASVVRTAQARDPLRVAFPPDGARIAADDLELALKIQGGTPPFTVLLNDRPQPEPLDETQTVVTAPGRGATRVTVLDSHGGADHVTVWLE